MTRRLDALLGHLTMYRLILLSLVLLALVAVVEALFGIIAFSPVDLIVSLAVAVAASWASNRAVARLFRVRPHGESSVITGLLVFCLFWPALSVQDVVALLLAAVAANLSKYVLAVHGRHVFNPVALGALVVDVSAISGATWWVATPPLLPVILLAGGLIVYRTGAYGIVGAIVLIDVAGTALRSAAGGSPFASALFSAVASNPFVFLAAFMATEPLTLPPRRWQRLLVGAVVGGVALVPLHLGWVSMSPELALVIGNAVAFPFGPRRRVGLTLVGRRDAELGYSTLTFETERPVRLRPGQYVELSLPHRGQDGRGARRTFSPANRPGTDEVLIATRFAERSSSFKRRLAELPVGATVQGGAVGGDFLLPRREDVPLLWVAGGIGVTPFRSFADDLAAAGPPRDVILVHAVRDGAELALDDVYGRAGVALHVIGPESIRSMLPEGARWAGPSLRRLDWGSLVPDLRRRTAYLAGSPAMVGGVRDALRRAGVRRVRRDRFIGY